MKLATFSDEGPARIGVVENDVVVDVSRAAPGVPSDMVALLEAGDEALAAVRDAASAGTRLPLASVRLHAPVLRPPGFIIFGANYRDHAQEMAARADAAQGGPRPLMAGEEIDVPLIATKQISCINGPNDDIHLPSLSKDLDYEAELALVIGKRCRNVSRENAAAHIAGYLVANDVSVRDYQMRSPTVTIGKSFDTHGPIGPWIVTPDEIGNPHDLGIRCWVNDELRQDSNTKFLIQDCYDIVSSLSRIFTLLPGTLIATGTPGGVGFAAKPPRFLKVGDVVRVEVDRIGVIENRVVAEPVGV